MAKTLYDKLWDAHVVKDNSDGTVLLYIDRHLIHEVTSPQAFDGLRAAGRALWRGNSILAVPDHNVPTEHRERILDPVSRRQLEALEQNVVEFELRHFDLHDRRQGIVHIIGPEQGFTQPGITIVCGDSHTATHGALAALGFGIGTSDVEHVFATQTLVMKKSRNFRVQINGRLSPGVTAKDIILAIIGRIGTAGATGHTLEYAGSTIRELSIEARMSICNMSIEAGARAGLVGVDDKTIGYLRGRPYAPQGEEWEQAEEHWREFVSDPDAVFDRELRLRAEDISPQVSWGTSPEMVAAVDGRVPDPAAEANLFKRQAMEQALRYMDLRPGTLLTEIPMDKAFIGSCTNGRLEDLRAAAEVVRGQHVAPSIRQALVVPGSGLVRAQAEAEGLDKVFTEAGFEWREPGCSMCLGMNPDQLGAGERCASTSNRNFEGRQGAGGRTHLASPAMVAAAAIHGHFVDLRKPPTT